MWISKNQGQAKASPNLLKINWDSFRDLSSILKKVSDKYSYDYHVRTLAEALTQGTRTYDEKVYSISRYLFSVFTQNKDPKEREFLQTPKFLARKILRGEPFSGDCDDLSVFLCALFRSIGFDSYMIYVSPLGDPPYTHTFPIIETPEGEFFKIDFLARGEPSNYGRIKAIKITR